MEPQEKSAANNSSTEQNNTSRAETGETLSRAAEEGIDTTPASQSEEELKDQMRRDGESGAGA